MSVQSKFYQVTPLVLLEYKSDQYKMTSIYNKSGQDLSYLYMYQGLDGNQYCVELPNISATKYPDETDSTYYFGGLSATQYDLIENAQILRQNSKNCLQRSTGNYYYKEYFYLNNNAVVSNSPDGIKCVQCNPQKDWSGVKIYASTFSPDTDFSNKNWVLSVDVMSTVENAYIGLYFSSNYLKTIKIPKPNVWTRISYAIKNFTINPNEASQAVSIYLRNDKSISGNTNPGFAYIKNWQLEAGTIATEYQTAESTFGSDMFINGRKVGDIILDKNFNTLRQEYINHDTIRLYILTGYVMNAIAGYSIKVKARINKVSYTDASGKTTIKKINDYLYLCDWYMPKEQLKDKIQWLSNPMYMNSKFYDRYIDIQCPSAVDIALNKRNIDYVYEYPSETGNIYMRGIPDFNSNFIIEFASVSPNAVTDIEDTASACESIFTLDGTKSMSLSSESNSNNFNVRLFEDPSNRSVIYYPVYSDTEYGDTELDLNMMNAIETGVIPMYDLADSDSLNNGMDDFIDMYGDNVYRWIIINELAITYKYTPIILADGMPKSESELIITEYQTNTIDYTGKTGAHGSFWKSKFVPYIQEKPNMSCISISITYTAHLFNRMNNIDIVRSGSMLITNPYRYMLSTINTNNINLYKIVNKIVRNSNMLINKASDDTKEKAVRSYYDVTNLIIKDPTSGQLYTNGKMTLYLTHSNNNYMLRLFMVNDDNVRVPYDMSGPYEYKLVFPTVNGTKLEIQPNKDSSNYNLGIGSLIFYITNDKAKAIMDVPASERYFSLMTNMTGYKEEETTLYEGKVEWYV